jgi:replicative DNA helicase
LAAIDEIEKTVLAILIDNPDRTDEAALIPEHFFNAKARKIYQAIQFLRSKELPCDVLSIATNLEESGLAHISGVDIVSYLQGMHCQSCSGQTLGFYTAKLQDRYTGKKVIEYAEQAQRAINKGTKSGIEAAECLSAKLSTLETPSSCAVTLEDSVQRESEAIRAEIRSAAKGGNQGKNIPIGLGLEQICPGGLPLGVPSVLCGDTKSGKTTVAQNIIRHVSGAGHGTIVFNVEDGEELFRQKMLSAVSGVPLANIITRRLSEPEVRALGKAVRQSADMMQRVMVDSRSGPTCHDIVRAVKGYKSQLDTKLVVVDYLQILSRTNKIERESIREAMLTFQHAAKADNMHYMIISQLNRGHLHDRTDPKPRRQDLYGSGSIEQFSKLIFGVHNPALFGPPEEERHFARGEMPPPYNVWNNRMELWVIGNNRGEDNVYVNLEWDKPTGRLSKE